MLFSEMLKWMEKVRDLLNILVPNSKFFKRKSPCKLAFQNKLFADVSHPAGVLCPFWSLELHLPCCVAPYMPCQTTEKIREMLEISAEMSSIIPHLKPI